MTEGVSRDFEARLEAWFGERDWRLFGFQREARDAYLAGESGLIHSPTGSGKSLAAWLGPLAEADAAGWPEGGPRVLWITPLRALAADTRENLVEAADVLGGPGSGWRVEVRTGDTSQSVRARQRKRPPEALITTPESLSVLLSYADGANWFRRLACVVVDEWHELLGTKRGVQLELCLARLRGIAPGLRTWGLSATLANLAEARDVLLGPGAEGRLVRGQAPKTVRIRSVLPETPERFPWAGHLGIRLLPAVIEAIEAAGSTLLFTNTRSQAELWFQALVDARPDWVGRIALHHGSIDRKLRRRIEDALRAGELRCVVCTSSLDLGVDFSPVDRVMQVGSPKGVARLLQRAGRSGHRPGAVSEVLCVPTHAFELVEIAAARRAAEQGRIEARRPLTHSLDVLAQHLVTIALGGGFEADAMRAEVSRTHAFAGITDREWGWVMDFVTRGGQALQGYPQYRRVQDVDGRYRVTDRGIGQRHRMGIGTIASDTAMNIRWLTGGSLGTIEESFVSRLERGDRFLFAGRLVELARVRDMTAYVRRAKKGRRTVPRWQGGRMPLSTELADSVLEVLEAAEPDAAGPAEVTAVAGLLELQRRWSRLPVPGELLVEVTRSREGVSLFCYPFAGRLVHEGLATLLAWRLSRETPATFTLSANDYGLELLSRQEPDVDADRLGRLLAPGDLEADLLACMNTSEIAKRRFRDIARIAGLVFQGYPGRGKSTRQIQASSGLIFDVLERYDGDNLLLDQARREVLENQLETRRMRETLASIGQKEIVVERPERLTPLAFPLWAERLQSQILSSETWRDRVERMAASLERAAERRRKSA